MWTTIDFAALAFVLGCVARGLYLTYGWILDGGLDWLFRGGRTGWVGQDERLTEAEKRFEAEWLEQFTKQERDAA
jgi:hypothetical protein